MQRTVREWPVGQSRNCLATTRETAMLSSADSPIRAKPAMRRAAPARNLAAVAYLITKTGGSRRVLGEGCDPSSPTRPGAGGRTMA